jgi:hypothetical protein
VGILVQCAYSVVNSVDIYGVLCNFSVSSGCNQGSPRTGLVLNEFASSELKKRLFSKNEETLDLEFD